MRTTSLAEVEFEIQERLKKAEHTIAPIKTKKQNAALSERQRNLAVLAGMRGQFLREMENIKNPAENKDVLLILNAKVVAIEQAIDAIEKT